jgi:hypothetical protein
MCFESRYAQLKRKFIDFTACRNDFGPPLMNPGSFMRRKNRAESASWK